MIEPHPHRASDAAANDGGGDGDDDDSRTEGRCNTCMTEHGCEPGPSCDSCVAGISSCRTTCQPPLSVATRKAFCDKGAKLPWKAPQVAGIAVSADAQTWVDYKQLQSTSDPRPNRWRFDAQASMFWDERRRRYVGTDRAFRPCQQGEMPGGEAEACGRCPIWWQPHGGCQDPPRPGCSAVQCNHTVRAIGTVTSMGGEFLTTGWGDNVEVLAPVPGLSGCRVPKTSACDNPTSQYYSQVTFPFYNIYLGIVMVFHAVDPPNVYGRGKVHCELVYTTDPSMTANWTRIAPGVDFIPLGTPMGEGKGQFDSHICFASGVPIRMDSEIYVYYMVRNCCATSNLCRAACCEAVLAGWLRAAAPAAGAPSQGGDGPHYSKSWPDPDHRNSSFGLATLRQDGFVALSEAHAACAPCCWPQGD
jgi:hypothetical protein